MNGLREYWYSLGARERAMVVFGSIAVLLIVVWATVLDPVNRRLDELRTQVPAKQNALRQLQAEADNVIALRQNGQPSQIDSSQPLMTVIEQTAASANLRDVVKRIQPGDDESVQVWLSDAYFDPWVQWVETLKQQGIEVLAATVNRGKDNTISVRVTFQRS